MIAMTGGVCVKSVAKPLFELKQKHVLLWKTPRPTGKSGRYDYSPADGSMMDS